MKKNFLPVILVFLFLPTFYSFGQDYKTGIGLRGGWISGLTVKHFIKEKRALEGIFSSGWRWTGYQFTFLYEIHKPAFQKEEVEGFRWFYGGGLHVAGGYQITHWHPNGPWTGYWHEHNYSAFGIDGIFGLEYQIPDLPVTLGADVKPFLEFSSEEDAPVNFWDAALSIRFVF